MASFAGFGGLSPSDLSVHPVARRAGVRGVAAVVILLGSAVLLFARLGNYSLWTDEASTAITARGVWNTGDTSAWLNDHNLLTYRNGLLLQHQKDRYTSPLQFYVAAPFIGLLGDTAFACRLPFALCGMATVCLMVWWLWCAQPPPMVWVAAIIILLGCPSFFLFQRQCRYYALATLLSTVVAYLYCNWNGSRWRLLSIGIAMALLLASQYLDYAAVVACLLIDYGIWGRRRRAIRGINWLILIAPQILIAAIVCPIWNPIARAASAIDPANSPVTHAAIAATSSHDWFSGFATLLWWNIRDLLACDFAMLPLLMICPALYFFNSRGQRGRADGYAPAAPVERTGISAAALRALLALLIFLGAIAFFTAHPISGEGNAEVRYLAPLLPLCVGIGILTVWAMQPLKIWTRAVLLLLAGVSMFLSPGTSSATPIVQSSSISYCSELCQPATEPYSPLASWINTHVAPKATIYVCPDWCVSPTMWDAPGPTYVWQLSDPPKPDYANLPAIYFKGRIAPDYLIAFGPYLSEIQDWQARLAARGFHYEPAATIPVYWKEMFRPELIWRSFNTIPAGKGEQIFIFRRANTSSTEIRMTKLE
jgi:4-amino-4-deoxy-L-arabinose transferase-like glycosyltransferase